MLPWKESSSLPQSLRILYCIFLPQPRPSLQEKPSYIHLITGHTQLVRPDPEDCSTRAKLTILCGIKTLPYAVLVSHSHLHGHRGLPEVTEMGFMGWKSYFLDSETTEKMPTFSASVACLSSFSPATILHSPSATALISSPSQHRRRKANDKIKTSWQMYLYIHIACQHSYALEIMATAIEFCCCDHG